MIPDELRTSLMLELHRAIDDAASEAMGMIANGRVSLAYPPGAALSAQEASALRDLALTPDAAAALEKLIRDAACKAPFHLFALMDGVADPEERNGKDTWLGLSFAPSDPDADEVMLHDEFFETYSDFDEKSER